MNKNVGTADRAIRAIFAIAVVILILTGELSGTLAWLLGIVAAVLFVTSFVSVCPLYLLLKITTRKSAPAK